MREGESPYVTLPTLTRCAHCGDPLGTFETWQAVGPDGRPHGPLCRTCASTVTHPEYEGDDHPCWSTHATT